MFKVSPASLQTFIDTRLTLTPSVIPNSNYVNMVSDWNCLKFTTAGIKREIECDQKVSVHLMITIQKGTSNVQSVPRQAPDIYWHTPGGH
jgi:hypothetical protein